MATGHGENLMRDGVIDVSVLKVGRSTIAIVYVVTGVWWNIGVDQLDICNSRDDGAAVAGAPASTRDADGIAKENGIDPAVVARLVNALRSDEVRKSSAHPLHAWSFVAAQRSAE